MIFLLLPLIRLAYWTLFSHFSLSRNRIVRNSPPSIGSNPPPSSRLQEHQDKTRIRYNASYERSEDIDGAKTRQSVLCNVYAADVEFPAQHQRDLRFRAQRSIHVGIRGLIELYTPN